MSQLLQELLKKDNQFTILYVEDNAPVRENTLELLQIFFDHIDVASDGIEGLERYKEFYEAEGKSYDIVLTDINMPRMNGIKMIEEIRKLQERQNFIVVSAHNEADYLIKLIDLEVTHFIIKPIDIDRFEKIFAQVIEIIMRKREFKSMNKSLADSKKIAEEMSRQKSQFLANMSHEIRTPLNAITGFITLLEENETDEKKLKYLNIIKNSSDTLVQIINDILDISKIESGKLKIEPHNFNPYENLVTIAELFQAKAAQKKIDFKIKYNNNMPKMLYGDALRIKQIFTNLISNAIKFTPEGSIVKCVVWYKEGKLNIIVKDYGIGISEKKQKSIFEPFTQADESTERVYGGTGLGLTISLELSRMLGGELTLWSKEGKGSTFKLSVPMPLGEEESETEEEEELKLHGNVLIVEDYEANRMFLGIILENAGLTSEMANDGVEAIEKFKTGRYDLILMDENMPNLGGMDATKEILKIERENALPHTPVISLTANALQGDRERFLEAGFDDYLAKPIDQELLLKTMYRLLKKDEGSH
jgi:signal transduction histidine kinase